MACSFAAGFIVSQESECEVALNSFNEIKKNDCKSGKVLGHNRG